MSDSDESGSYSDFGDSGEYCCSGESCVAEIFGDSGHLEESDDFFILVVFVILVNLMILLNLVNMDILVNLDILVGLVLCESGGSGG